MATTLDSPAVTTGGWILRPSARKMADEASRRAIERAGLQPDDIDLLLNAGLYHDRNLGEPALAALIQEDVDINRKDPQPGGHGTFSFDIANGACGVLTALEVADGFLKSGTIEHALVVASDADPGHRLAPRFPFSPRGAAIVCHFADGPAGLAGFRWDLDTEEDGRLGTRVGFEEGRNVLRVDEDPDFGARAGTCAGKNAKSLLADHGVRPDQVDLVVANPLTPSFLEGLSATSGIGRERFVMVAGAEHVHTAALLVALAAAEEQDRRAQAHHLLMVSAGAGIVVGAALLRQ